VFIAVSRPTLFQLLRRSEKWLESQSWCGFREIDVCSTAEFRIKEAATDLAKETDQDVLDQAVTDLSSAAHNRGPAMAAAIAKGLADAFADEGVVTGTRQRTVKGFNVPGSSYPVRNYLLDDAFKAAIGNGAGPELTIATAAALRGAGKADGAKAVDQALVDGVKDLRKKYDDAQKRYAQLDVELQKDLLDFGPVMTDKEKAAYAKAFWADNTRPTDEKHDGDPSHAEAKVGRRKTSGATSLSIPSQSSRGVTPSGQQPIPPLRERSMAR
jgi:hypothetical protein